MGSSRGAAAPLERDVGARPCTEGGTRTLTPFRTADFESAASAIPPLRPTRASPHPLRSLTTERRPPRKFRSRRAIDEHRDWRLSRAPMPSSLRNRLNELAASFSAGVLDAIRGASLEELLSESPGGRRVLPSRAPAASAAPVRSAAPAARASPPSPVVSAPLGRGHLQGGRADRRPPKGSHAGPSRGADSPEARTAGQRAAASAEGRARWRAALEGRPQASHDLFAGGSSSARKVAARARRAPFTARAGRKGRKVAKKAKRGRTAVKAKAGKGRRAA